jgi:putative phosphoribosyl transferase
MVFRNRHQAGKLLGEHLLRYHKNPDVIVLGLPRGGIPVAYEVAKTLNAPLDAVLVQKLGVPGEEELAMGALAANDVVYLNHTIIQQLHLSDQTIQEVISREQDILEERNLLYRHGRGETDLTSKIAIVVDDGLATGASLKAAITLLKHQHLKELIVAVPVAPRSTYTELSTEVDSLICLEVTDSFSGVGAFYQDFTQTSDEEVCHLLAVREPQEDGL